MKTAAIILALMPLPALSHGSHGLIGTWRAEKSAGGVITSQEDGIGFGDHWVSEMGTPLERTASTYKPKLSCDYYTITDDGPKPADERTTNFSAALADDLMR